MKKAIQFESIITSIRSLTDRSLSLTMHSPELTSKERASFMELQGINLKTFIEPLEENVPEIKIDKDLDSKSASERLRNTLYVLYLQEGEPGEFSEFYHLKMESIIKWVKRKLA